MDKTQMPKVAGLLNICSGGIGEFAAFVLLMGVMYPDPAFQYLMLGLSALSGIAGILAIIGGIYATQRKKWKLAFAGSIAALSPILITGIVSIILILRSKKEFT